MTDVAFETKLAFFAPESDIIEVECPECGARFTKSRHYGGHTKLCPECRPEVKRKREKAYYQKMNANLTNDPVTSLALAVVNQAKIDAQSKKVDKRADAEDWLKSQDGLESWLKFCGISLRPSQIMRIRRIV